MSKYDKKQNLKINKVKKDSTFWMSMFILVIMVVSVVGFALSSAPSRGSGSSTTGGDIPLGQIYQNPDTGELYWGARLNGEEFMFATVEGFDESFVEAGLASKIKAQENVVIYVDTDFVSNEAVFLVEKALRGIGIESSRVYSPVCESNTLVFTNDVSYGAGGACMKFVVGIEEDAMLKAEKVMYHLIKDYSTN